MKTRFLFLIFIITAGAMSAAAQSRTVTNNELAQYKQERVKAETDLRENYERLGFASPEEFDRRNKQSAKETADLAEKLRQEDLERERVTAQLRANARLAAAFNRPTQFTVEPIWPYANYIWSYVRHRPLLPIRHGYSQPGYFAGGQFWPTGSQTPTRPMFGHPRH